MFWDPGTVASMQPEPKPRLRVAMETAVVPSSLQPELGLWDPSE